VADGLIEIAAFMLAVSHLNLLEAARRRSGAVWSTRRAPGGNARLRR